MKRINTTELTLTRFISFIILLDLIFGGSGRVIMIGSISLRMIIFAAALFLTLAALFTEEIRFDGIMTFLIILFLLYLCFSVLSVGSSAYSVRMDYFLRYFYIVLLFFYEYYFGKYPCEEEFEKLRILFENMTLIFAGMTILIWCYALVAGFGSYQIIELRFLRPLHYGSFDFFGSGIPRLFMKGCIFVAIGLLFQADRFFAVPSVKNAFKVFLLFFATLITFTSGLYVAVAVCVMLLLHRERILVGNRWLIVLFAFLLFIFAAWRFHFVETMLSRYSGDYSSSYRLTQLSSILKEFEKKPILGHGFGHEFTTFYGNTIRTTSNFEIAWGELLVDTGIIGFLLFIAILFITFIRIRLLSKGPDTIYLFGLGLLLICIESLSNPFINNSLGMTYFAICAGAVNTLWKMHVRDVTNRQIQMLESNA